MSVSEFDRDELATTRRKNRDSAHEELSPAQQELLRDMRESLRQMKRGDALPAREAMCEIQLELKAEDDANSSNA